MHSHSTNTCPLNPFTLNKKVSLSAIFVKKKTSKRKKKTHIYQQHCDKNFSLSFNLLNVCVWVAGVVDRYHHRHFDITPHYTFKIRCFLQLETINTLKAAVLKLFNGTLQKLKAHKFDQFALSLIYSCRSV